jgi:hypothetical protein
VKEPCDHTITENRKDNIPGLETTRELKKRNKTHEEHSPVTVV